MSRIVEVQPVVVGTPWRELVMIEVCTDTGITGLGEVRMVNKTDTLLAAVRELSDRYLIGESPFDVSRLAWNIQVSEYGVPGEIAQSALAALDVACWDIMGKELGVPIWKLLGGEFRNRVPAYANGWYQSERDPIAIADLAEGVVDRGYRALKIDPFGAADGELEVSERRKAVEILDVLRQRVGSDIEIYLEMHGRFTAATALEVIRDVDGLDISWFEEPVPPHDLTGYATVRSRTDVRIATGERLHIASEVAPFLERGLVDVLQVDVTHFGGLTGVQRVAGSTLASNTMLAPHNVCGPVGTAAALHLGVVWPNFKTLEHFNDFADPWVQELVTEPPHVDPVHGAFELPMAPGLGFELRHDVCAEYPRTGGRLNLYREGWENRAPISRV